MGIVRTVLALVLLAFAAGAQAQQPAAPGARVALIIANSAYVQQDPLANPARDAEVVRRALQRAGFQTSVLANRKKAELDADLLAFRRRADAAEVALIYFAGHGMRVGQTNWLLPVDFDANGIDTEEDFEDFAISHRDMLRQLGRAPTRIAIFDACRDNPYEAAIAARMNLAARSATVPQMRNPTAPQPGLAAIEQDNVLVLFSAGAGQFASDGVAGQASPFAVAFADALTQKEELRVVAGAIRDKVIAATGGEASRTAQRPYLSGSLGGRTVYLMGEPQRFAPIGEEAAAFNKCNADWNAPCWRDYIARYPNGANIRAAKAVMQSLETQAAPAGTTALDRVDAARRALAAMTTADWSRGNTSVLATRLVAEHGRATLERAAQLGDSRAMWLVGRGYEFGLGSFPKSQPEAGQWYRASAAEGFGLGQSDLGGCYVQGFCGVTKDIAQATSLFRLSANQGFATGQAELGYSYNFGEGVPKDEVEGVRLYKLAADQGSALGQANLGAMYDEGSGGLEKNEIEALRLYRLAADQGERTGQANLGLMYEQGRAGLTRNRDEAVRLYRLAAPGGSALARRALQRLGETW